MADIVLKDRNGKNVTYEGIETVTFDTPTEGQQVVFTEGVAVEGLEIVPDFSGGDMAVNAPAGTLVKSAIIKKPTTEEFIVGESEGAIPLDFSDDSVEVTPSSPDKFISKVTIEKPETLIPENIAEGIDIGGVVGTLVGGGGGDAEVEAELIMGTLSGEYSNSKVTHLPPYAFGYHDYTIIGQSLTALNLPNCSTISRSALTYQRALERINIPSVTTIGSNAFGSCAALREIQLPACVSVSSSAFAYCVALETVNIPLLSSLPKGIFAGCTSLKSVNIPECTYIDQGAFSSASVPEVEFQKCSYIGSGAFQYAKINTASFPVCTSISANAFAYCNIANPYLPQCSIIGSYAFSACPKLTEITLPGCVSISASAFASCSALLKVILPGSSVVKLAASTVFISTPIQRSNAASPYSWGSVYVPASLVDSYKTASYWTYFSSRITAIEEATE